MDSCKAPQSSMEMNGAEVLIRMLIRYGVKYVFGVPGDTSLALYEALYNAAPEITHIMARDERSAGFMADAYARLSYRPGVAECPSGAGALYSVPGIAEANASSIPVILFTSGITLSGEAKGTITELDHQQLFESITKWSSLLKLATKLPETLRRAFRLAVSGRPGAVHLVLPIEPMNQKISWDEQDLWVDDECRTYPAFRTRGSTHDLDRAVDLLMAAERPVIVTGGGVNHSQAGAQILSMAEWLKAPVVTTISGQGVMPDDHPLALGVVGDNGFHPHANRAVEEADTLLYVGCKMGSVSTIKWTLPSYKPERKIIQVDVDPEMLGNNYSNILSINGDARLVLEDMEWLLKQKSTAFPDRSWVDQLNQARAEFWKMSKPLLKSDAMPLKPQRVVDALNRRLPTPSVVISDAGTPTPHITRYLKLGGGSRFLIPRAYGGLGYAIPAVVGSWLARPEAKPVGLFGDGSMGMTAGELETLVRLNVPAVLIHFNNSCFGWIKALQLLHCHGKFQSVDFNAGDMSRVAQAFGMPARHVETPDELEAAMDEAFAASGPFFLDIVTEPEVNDLPPVHSWLKAAGKDTGW